MTARGCTEEDFVEIADFIVETVELTKDLKKPKHKLADFKSLVAEASISDQRFIDLRGRVTDFSRKLPYFYED